MSTVQLSTITRSTRNSGSRGGGVPSSFYAVRTSPKLDAPAIFLSQEDALEFLHEDPESKISSDVEYQIFQDATNAVSYILDKSSSSTTSSVGNKRLRTADDPAPEEATAATRQKRVRTSIEEEGANTRGGTCQDKSRKSVARKKQSIVKVKTPTGKLGIEIQKGLVIGLVQEESPLFNKLRSGDRLVKIDGINVESWKAVEAIGHLRATADKERVLEVCRRPSNKNKAPLRRTNTHPADESHIVKVHVPKGRLDVDITKGPVIGKIKYKRTSPLMGKLYEGDQILKIDETNVENWIVKDVVALLDQISDRDRIFQVRRLISQANSIGISDSPQETVVQEGTIHDDSADPVATDKSYTLRMLDAFDKQFKRLEQFKAEYGDVDVPVKRAIYRVGDKTIDQGKYSGLGLWVKSMRTQLKVYAVSPMSCLLTKEQYRNLRNIGFCMEPKRGVGRTRQELFPAWDEERYQELLTFYTQNGHCMIPENTKNTLHSWLDRVRLARNDLNNGVVATITKEEITRLDALGVDWTSDRYERMFNENFKKWRDFKARYPGRDPKHGSREHQWVQRVRRGYTSFMKGEPRKAGIRITRKQIEQLTAAGFQFESKFKSPVRNGKPMKFDDRIEQLKAYKERHGDCRVPQLLNDPPGLGLFVNSCRKNYKNWKLEGKESNMTEERYQKLVDIGFDFGSQKGRRFNQDHPFSTLGASRRTGSTPTNANHDSASDSS